MLVSLIIKNIVLIESLTINFQKGFCALTGETGAGKSILLDSLGLALGARSDSALIRQGTDQAKVIAEFEVDKGHHVYNVLEDADLEIHKDEPLIFKRSLGIDGRSRAYINDQPVSASLLKKAGNLLVEVHGQFDTRGLLDHKMHLDMLDAYGEIDLNQLKSDYEKWSEVAAQLEKEKNAIQQAAEEEEYLKSSLEDLDALNPEENEEESLVNLKEKLLKREQFISALHDAYENVGSAQTSVGKAYKAIDLLGDNANEISETMDRASAEIDELLNLIRSFSEEIEHSEYSLEEIDERLFGLRSQARKHSCSVEALPKIRDEIANKLSQIDAKDDLINELSDKVYKAKEAYIRTAEKISLLRRKVAKDLEKKIGSELVPLKLDKANFVVDFSSLEEDSWGPAGTDSVSYLIATNPGSTPGPLNKVASGGELARLMLALKVVLAKTGSAPSLVFDEVDSGIGGAVSAAVGERLSRLSKEYQILVVTHSPQVAAQASSHWIVLKDEENGIRTQIIPLEELSERREEIARMLAGSKITKEARAAALKLLEAA
jgi:DNA repair protein RecN (Recombination protein N)